MNFVSNDNATSLFTAIGNRFRKRPPTFTGTQAEWNALTAVEKEQYDIVNITNDYDPAGGGGHTIQDAEGNDLEQRDVMQYAGYLSATDDDTNGKTVISDAPTSVTWATWQTMTAEQKAGKKWLITEAPDGGGGHVIQNQSGTDMAQEAKMQFKDAHVTDDSTNGKTKIEVVKEVTLSQFNVLPTDGSADGIYKIGDGQGGSGIEAGDIEYDNTTSGLSADDVQDAIDELVGNLGTASAKNYTTSITQSSSDLPTAGAVYSYIDNMITQALTGSY